jgi:O-antigen/teichoic acid export membrane protein
MRAGVLAIGISTSLMLPFMVLQAGFVGLQRYGVLAALTSGSRLLTACGTILLLVLHGGLRDLAFLMAGFNLATMAAQWFCWRHYASREIPVRLFILDRAAARRLLEYCGILSIWTMGSLLISGLDTVIVGRYDFHRTGFYGVAASATSFMLLIVGSALGPLMPAISSVQGQRTPAQLGDMLVRATRYCALLLLTLGLPLLVGAYPLLRLWLGPVYAAGAERILAVLVAANMIRQLGYPYALMVVATGSQRRATLSPVLEGVVNLAASLLLVRRMGAIGVAWGTLVGAVVGIAAHAFISMPRTRSVVAPSRRRMLRQGLLRPALCLLPTLIALPWLRARSLLPLPPAALLLWAAATVALVLYAGLTRGERLALRSRALALL